MAGNPQALATAKYNQISDADLDPLPDDIRDRARLLVCSFAQGDTLDAKVADADLLMRYLGIHPSQDRSAVSATTPSKVDWR